MVFAVCTASESKLAIEDNPESPRLGGEGQGGQVFVDRIFPSNPSVYPCRLSLVNGITFILPHEAAESFRVGA